MRNITRSCQEQHTLELSRSGNESLCGAMYHLPKCVTAICYGHTAYKKTRIICFYSNINVEFFLMLFKQHWIVFGKCTGKDIEIPYLMMGLLGNRSCGKDLCYHYSI